MLRVGLTGGLGSGKSTVAAMFREHGVHVLEADAIARELMQPGQSVYQSIVDQFGPSVVSANGALDRARLAELAFGEGRLHELNRIVHPPTVAEQERRTQAIAAVEPNAIVMVESALIFEAEAWGTVPEWRKRFDRVLLVTAPDDLRIQRHVARILTGTAGPAGATPEMRAAAEHGARARLASQLPDSEKASRCDAVIDNSGGLEATRRQVDRIAAELRAAACV
jgi:dephospho-CoA kinase